MRILHISDFHFVDSPHSIRRQSKVVSKLVEEVQKVDMIFFTGDLVHKGNKESDFTKAAIQLFNPLLQKLNLNISDLFICPGNHDVNRTEILESNISYIYEKINSNQLLNNFVKKANNKDYKLSFASTANYFNFFNIFFKQSIKDNSDIVHRLYSIYKREYLNKKIGIVSLNSAWVSYSDEDRGQLLFPEILLQEASDQIKDCFYKVVLIHHPLEFLAYFNKTIIEDIIFQDFDFLFLGDIHKRKNGVHYNADGGIVEIVSPATLTQKGDGEIGYSIIDVDDITEEVKIQVSFYNESSNNFHTTFTVPFEFPRDEIKARYNKLRRSVRELFNSELEKANELFLLRYNIETKKNFLELFNPPALKDKDEVEIILKPTFGNNIELSKIYSNLKNFLIYGKDKSGKSSILKKIQLDLLNDFSELKIIPFYIDCKRIQNKQIFNVETELKRYLSHFSASDIKTILNEFKIVILIDDIDYINKSLRENIEKFIQEYGKTNLIATASLTLFRRFKSVVYKADKFQKLFIHNITKSQIRTYSKKLLEKDDDTIDEILTNLMTSFKQFNLPFNYWTLSIFLWIYNKTKNFTFQNNAELIEHYIDKLLDKEELALSQDRTFTFNNYKNFLSELAYDFYKHHCDTGYCTTYGIIFHFTEEYLSNNPRNIATPQHVLDYIFEKKILTEVDENTFTFRLNSDFEYFLAFYITNNPSFREEIINDDSLYLSFKNELDLHSGINRNDELFLTKIFNKTKESFSKLNEKYKATGTHDENLILGVKDTINFSESINLLLKEKPLDFSKQDEVVETIIPNLNNDSYEVKTKDNYDKFEVNFKILEQHLFILSRIFRNSDEIKNIELVNSTFNFILDSYINLGFLLIEEVGDINKIEELITDESKRNEEVTLIKNLISLTLNLIPLLMQVSLYESLGHINFENIIHEKLKNAKLDFKRNQYLIFLLTYLLIDLDIKKNSKLLTELPELLSNNSLINSSIVKQTFYFIFKAHNNPVLETLLRENIKKQTIELNPALSSRENQLKIDSHIDEKKKLSLIIRNKET
jgi:DNA repair exonuclease SbcCD nuclease subunit